MCTGFEYALLATTIGTATYSGIKQHQAQKEGIAQAEKQHKRDSSRPPQSPVEQKKIDYIARAGNAFQNNLIAGARNSSTATGGTTLG